MRDLLADIKQWATDYEPAVAKALVAAALQIFAAAGIGLGDLPAILDAVLGFVAIATTVIAGRSIRGSVYSPATHDGQKQLARIKGYQQGISDQKFIGGDRQ